MKTYNKQLTSYVFLELKGKMPERFLSICKARNLPVYDICCNVTKKGTITTARMRLSDYYRIRPAARKAGCFPVVRKRLGILFFLKRYKARLVFFFGGLYFFWLIYLLSTFLWSIRVSGGFVHTTEELTAYLAEKGIRCGIRHRTIDCDSLEKQIRLDYPDIGWVSAELKGTKLILQISETSQPQKASETTESSICASSDGIVVSILCTNGTPLVKEGDVVRKGDILISGIVPIIGDNDTLVDTKLVAADGTVILQTMKNYEYRFSGTKQLRTATGNETNGISFYWRNNKIFSVMPSHNYENYDIIQKDMAIFRNNLFHLPFLLKTQTICEYSVAESTYSEEEIREIAETALQEYIEYLKNNGTKVISAFCETLETEGWFISRGQLIIQSPAWERVPVTEE